MAERNDKGQYLAGTSGNPGGQQKGLAAFREKLATLDEQAFLVMQEALHSGDQKVQLMALKEFYDRRWGKATQAVELTGPNGGPMQSIDLTKATPEQLEQLRQLAIAIVGK